MPDLIDGSENVSVHGILNWIILLFIFSVITVIGNYLGYKHPMTDSLVGMGILSLITLAGVWMERELPFNISSIIYISVIGILLGAAMLFAFKLITFEIPVSALIAFNIVLGLFGTRGFEPGFHVVHTMCGGILFGAFFMATDYVTSPMTSNGQLIYGSLIGTLMGLFHILRNTIFLFAI